MPSKRKSFYKGKDFGKFDRLYSEKKMLCA